MLLSLKQMCGRQLLAQDGKVGHVQDFYFDDQKWAVRYVVAHTGSWLTERLVLIASRAIQKLIQKDDCLVVDLSREQIQNSPEITPDEPVSRPFEEKFFCYYVWPSYWDRDGILGPSGLPVVVVPDMERVVPTYDGCLPDGARDSHLRSAKALRNYHIQSEQGGIGHLIDFIIEDGSWEIRHLIVDTGHWNSGKEIAVSPQQIHHVSHDDSTIFVTMTRDAIENAPEFGAMAIGGPAANRETLSSHGPGLTAPTMRLGQEQAIGSKDRNLENQT